ncbi:MAG: hypothetical protein G01um101430_348 [Parcubacteria group bacterium Gr01-1014_30]|nr:MAG: hypothetical protein G01um101430_348 [Parcubacteria group bacterium Gr01-1014_30]
MVTIILLAAALSGWLLLKRNPDRYIHEKTSPMNIFFKWGHAWHHIFKVAIIILVMIVVFSLYKYLLAASRVFALTVAVLAGVILSGGKELLDKYITLDDVISSALAIIAGFLLLFFLF